MATGASLFAFLAGVLSTLSPCVLPLLPLVLGAAVSEHRLGLAALAAGLALSFVAIGLFVATIGFSMGLDAGIFRGVAALLLLAVGLVLMVPRLQAQLALAGGPVSGWTDRRLGDLVATGLKGQFVVGLLLGAVWSPCVGPTLGAASPPIVTLGPLQVPHNIGILLAQRRENAIGGCAKGREPP
jgi:cytochrome c biogenesis protein CcdA